MILFIRRFNHLPVRYVYFAERVSFCQMFLPIEHCHALTNRRVIGFKRKKMLSLQTSLTKTMDEILISFSSTCRNEIRRSIREGISCKVTNDREKYIKFFNDFAEEKKINKISIDHLNSYGNNYIIVEASKDNRSLAYHTILFDKNAKISVLMTSSNARFSDSAERKLISMANRHLHYFEMEYLKEIGIEIYDYGGIARDEDIIKNPSLKGVNDFKKSFGGTLVDNYEYESISFFVLRKIAQIFGIVKSNVSLQNK